MIAVILLCLAALAYILATLGFQFSLRQRAPEWLSHWNRLIGAGFALHSTGLLALAISLQRLPLETMKESIGILAWIIIAIHLLLAQPWKMESLGSVAAPTAAVLTAVCALTLGPDAPLPPRGPWFFLHVGSLTSSYACFSLAAGSAVLYFLQARRLKHKKINNSFRLPALDSLDRAAYRFILVGFPLLVIGIVSGMRITGWNWNWEERSKTVGSLACENLDFHSVF